MTGHWDMPKHQNRSITQRVVVIIYPASLCVSSLRKYNKCPTMRKYMCDNVGDFPPPPPSPPPVRSAYVQISDMGFDEQTVSPCLWARRGEIGANINTHCEGWRPETALEVSRASWAGPPPWRTGWSAGVYSQGVGLLLSPPSPPSWPWDGRLFAVMTDNLLICPVIILHYRCSLQAHPPQMYDWKIK